MSESDIVGPIDYLNDIENLVSFESAMFEDYSFKIQNENIPIIYVNITTLLQICHILSGRKNSYFKVVFVQPYAFNVKWEMANLFPITIWQIPSALNHFQHIWKKN